MNGQASFWDTAAPNRYKPAQLWYDTTDQRLVVLVDGKEVPVVEPVLPGLEVVPEAAPKPQPFYQGKPGAAAPPSWKPRFVDNLQAGSSPGQTKIPGI